MELEALGKRRGSATASAPHLAGSPTTHHHSLLLSAMSLHGTFATCRMTLRMSASRGRPEVSGALKVTRMTLNGPRPVDSVYELGDPKTFDIG
jgi:hypothetical protein